MKLAIIGGAGVRVPLLVNGLVRSDLPITTIALFDPDHSRMATIAEVARRMIGNVDLVLCKTSAECIAGSDFVFTSIRVGGIAARAKDEAAALAHGVIGQETVGPCGFAMALRTIPAIVAYAKEVAELAPSAWMINFTNPVGIITQAIRTHTSAKVIGICDTPTELFEDVAHALSVPSAECHFDYFGLNHLGWLREVYHRGEPQLGRLMREPKRLADVYRAPLFESAFLANLRLLPTEYVYYYYRPELALANIRRAGTTRGQSIERMNEQLFADLRSAPDPVATYEAYLDARNAGYMQIESGAASGRPASPWAALTGYDKIALSTVRAIHFNRGDLIPLNVSNRGNLSHLEDADVVEVPCVVNANGALPVHVEPVPEAVVPLLTRVKRYERLTVAAAFSRSRNDAITALNENPLIGDRALSERLLDALAIELS